MEAITSFLTSNEALKWLGLPGFVTLLAFLFYRYLIQKGVIPRLSKNGGLAVVLSIIAFFAFALYISVDRFSEQKPIYSRDDTISFLKKMNFTTEIGDIEKYFGPPSSVEDFVMYDESRPEGNTEIRTGIKIRTYQRDSSIYLAVYSLDNEIVAYGLWGKGITLPVPMYFLGEEETDEVLGLGQIPIKNLHGVCAEKTEVNTRTQWFLIGPCYFGAPGKYQNFALAFENWLEKFEDCEGGDDIQGWWKAYNLGASAHETPKLPCKSMKNLTATAAAVSSSSLGTGHQNVPTARDFLNDFTDRIGFGKGFTD